MRTLLKAAARSLFVLALACSAAATTTAARERDDRVITARAGGVNFVAGDVTFKRAGESDWRQLTKDDDLRSGDAVRTGRYGRAEILLNPGSYLRLDYDSEFELTDASLAGLRLRLARGRAIVEAMGYGSEGLSFVVSTPNAQATIVRTGVYRFKVAGPDSTEIVVQKGRALLGADRSAQLKEGRAAVFARAGGFEIVKWEQKKSRDGFDEWSRERAEHLARINNKLQVRRANSLLARTNFDDLFGMSSYSFLGFWLFDAGYGCYTFIPLMYGWGSPYGFHYNARFFPSNCRPCRRLPVYQAYQNRAGSSVANPFPPTGGGSRTGYGSDTNASKQVHTAPADSKHATTGGGGAAAVGAKGTSPKN